MKKIFHRFALIPMSLTILISAQAAGAQYKYNYSSNIWVNSGMNLLFQKRWANARIRAAGKTELADALEGRRSNHGQKGNDRKGAARIASPLAEDVLRRVPLSLTSFKATSVKIMPLVLAAKLVDSKTEESRPFLKASTELLENYEEMLVSNKETRLKNNVAGAAAFALVMSRSVLTDGKKELSEKQS